MNKPLLKTQSYINGKWCDADSAKTFSVMNPFNAELVARVADCGVDETHRAIEAADKAFKTWSKTTADERSRCLSRWFELLLSHQAEIAELMTLESGKPLSESSAEVAYAASFVQWFSEEAKRVNGEIIPSPLKGRRLLVSKQPIGVCAAITPWNFPLAMITRKCAPALAAGCSVVVKPAESTPLSALAAAELASQAGIPAGVFNVVTASHGKDIGEMLTSHPKVRKVSFTGSTAVGKLLLKQSAETVKRVSMELGGNAPFIVFDDADVNLAVEGAMASKFRNTGQTCVCANRFLIQEGIYTAFVSAFAKRCAELKVGDGLESGVQQGPLINTKAMVKVDRLVKDAVAKGAEVITGGGPHRLGGNFYQPTILTGIQQNMAIANEEIFGPVAPIFQFTTEEQAIQLANDTPYGLAAYFYSQNISRVWRVADALEYGMLGINEGAISTAVAPFGGVKESGLGREGSQHGIDEYLELKYLCMGGLNAYP